MESSSGPFRERVELGEKGPTMKKPLRKRWEVFCFWVLVLFPSWGMASETDCGMQRVHVEYSAQIDAEISCEGIRRAVQFFKSYGFEKFQQINVKIQDRINLNSLTENNLAKEITCCFFTVSQGYSGIISWETIYNKNKKIFGSIPYSKEYYSSLVAHEVAHDLYFQNFKNMSLNIDRPLTEFVSYVVQISTMQKLEREEVLKLWPNRNFRSENEINSMTWAMSPNLFGIMSYRFHVENPNFVRSILTGKVHSGDELLPPE